MSTVPDAWDDDWQVSADSSKPTSQPAKPILTRAERNAQHAEKNKQLWESADRSEGSANPYDLIKNEVPLANGFKPAIAVLARKPKPIDRVAQGMNNVSLLDEDDSEEEARKKSIADLAQRQAKAKLEREEKQRKYAEARERLFGPASSSSQEGLSTDLSSRKLAQPRKPPSQSRNSPRSSQTASPAAQNDTRPQPDTSRRLFDPLESASPRLNADNARPVRSGTPGTPLIKPSRQPTGPDGSGPNGHGFNAR